MNKKQQKSKQKNKQKKRQNKIAATVVAVFLALLLAGLLIWVATTQEEEAIVADEAYIQELKDNGLGLYNDPHSDLKMIYSDELSIAINQEPVQGVTANLTKSDPRIQITTWIEEGEFVANLSLLNRDVSDLLVANLKTKLPQTYSNFELISDDTYDLNGRRVGEVVFSYTSGDATDTVQKIVVLPKDTETAVYVAAQTPKEDYDEVSSKYFDTVFESLAF